MRRDVGVTAWKRFIDGGGGGGPGSRSHGHGTSRS